MTLLALISAASLTTAQTPAAVPAAATPADLRQWGMEALKSIQDEYWIPTREQYAEEITVGQPAPDKPAFMWGCGVELSALNAAARLDRRTYTPLARRYAHSLEAYWSDANGRPAYDVQPGPKSPDRYYDDNIWVTLDMVDLYDITHDRQFRDRAEQIFRFVQSGEDTVLGGGIYWHEQEHNLKGSCSNGSATTAALRLYQITGKQDYLATAHRLYDWMNGHLQDKDGLFFDAMETSGKLHPMKWSYNTALMIRANCLFYAQTREKKYLEEAERIARAAEAYWVRKETGAITDEGWFAHLLTESFLFLYEQDNDSHWLTVVRQGLQFLHDNARDPAGHYGKRWDAPLPAKQEKVPLLYQASAARAFLTAARYTP